MRKAAKTSMKYYKDDTKDSTFNYKSMFNISQRSSVASDKSQS